MGLELKKYGMEYGKMFGMEWWPYITQSGDSASKKEDRGRIRRIWNMDVEEDEKDCKDR